MYVYKLHLVVLNIVMFKHRRPFIHFKSHFYHMFQSNSVSLSNWKISLIMIIDLKKEKKNNNWAAVTLYLLKKIMCVPAYLRMYVGTYIGICLSICLSVYFILR